MSDDTIDTGGSGGGGEDHVDVSASDFFNPEADSLWGRVDFLGMIGTFGKATVVGFFSFFAGIVLSVERSVESVFEASMGNVTGVTNALTTSLADAQSAAIQAASADVNMFGIFSITAGNLALLASFLSAAVLVYLFLGWGDP
jgi:hypothetical protein